MFSKSNFIFLLIILKLISCQPCPSPYSQQTLGSTSYCLLGNPTSTIGVYMCINNGNNQDMYLEFGYNDNKCDSGYSPEFNSIVLNSRALECTGCTQGIITPFYHYIRLDTYNNNYGCESNDDKMYNSNFNFNSPPSNGHRYLVGETCLADRVPRMGTSATMNSLGLCLPGDSLYKVRYYDMGLLYSCIGDCGHGSCNSGSCACQSGWQGANCDIDSNECAGVNSCNTSSTTCDNIVGGYNCLCLPGYSRVDSYNCIDINECSNGQSLCDLLTTTCQNDPGTYSCKCLSGYSRVNSYSCLPPSASINSVSQIGKNKFQINASQLGSNINLITDISIGLSNCTSPSWVTIGSIFSCYTPLGNEVVGQTKLKLSGFEITPYTFSGSPYIDSYSSITSEDKVIISIQGKRFPASPTFQVDQVLPTSVQYVSSSSTLVVITIPRGTGIKSTRLYSNQVENTDTQLFYYPVPIIDSVSNITSNGGLITIEGSNFGTNVSLISNIMLGPYSCENPIFIRTYYTIKCTLPSSLLEITHNLILSIDQQDSILPFYVNIISSNSNNIPICKNDCNANGNCTEFGCKCKAEFTGTSCNETSIETIPIPNEDGKAEMEIGEPKNPFSISVVAIQEFNYKNQLQRFINLSSEHWSIESLDPSILNTWTYQLTLNDNSSLTCKFQYLFEDREFNFSSKNFTLPKNTVKLSIEIRDWKFLNRLNRIELLIETNSPNDQKEIKKICGKDEIPLQNNPTINLNNQMIYLESKNTKNGMYSRFLSIAETDNNHPIISNLRVVSVNGNKVIIATSVPYFSKKAIIDPDFSIFLNVESSSQENSIECNDIKSSPSSSKWKLIVGVTIGSFVGLASIVGITLLINKRIQTKKWNKELNLKLQK